MSLVIKPIQFDLGKFSQVSRFASTIMAIKSNWVRSGWGLNIQTDTIQLKPESNIKLTLQNLMFA